MFYVTFSSPYNIHTWYLVLVGLTHVVYTRDENLGCVLMPTYLLLVGLLGPVFQRYYTRS